MQNGLHAAGSVAAAPLSPPKLAVVPTSDCKHNDDDDDDDDDDDELIRYEPGAMIGPRRSLGLHAGRSLLPEFRYTDMLRRELVKPVLPCTSPSRDDGTPVSHARHARDGDSDGDAVPKKPRLEPSVIADEPKPELHTSHQPSAEAAEAVSCGGPSSRMSVAADTEQWLASVWAADECFEPSERGLGPVNVRWNVRWNVRGQ